MEGTIGIDTERLLKWSKDSDNKWTIQLIKDEENSESDGHTNLRKENVWVYLEDLLPDQMIEYGEVLPKSGQEKKWLNSLTQSLRKRLRKMEKRK